MSFYLILLFIFGFSALCSYDSRYLRICSNQIIFSLLSLLLLLLAGFRYGIETDYWSYAKIFKSSENPGIEPLFYSIITFTKTFLADNYNTFVFLIAFVSVSLKLFFFSKLKQPVVALFIYFCFFYIMCEWNVIRQGTAVSFLLWSSKYAKERRPIPFFLLIIFATGLHISSIVFMPVYFLCGKSISVKNVIVYILFFLVVKYLLYAYILTKLISLSTFFLGGTLSEFMQRLLVYLNDDATSIITIGFLRRIAILSVFMIMNNSKKITNFYFQVYLMGFFIYIMVMENSVLSTRVSLPFELFLIPLFADMKIKCTLKNIYALICLFTISGMIFLYSIIGGNSIPYRTYLML